MIVKVLKMSTFLFSLTIFYLIYCRKSRLSLLRLFSIVLYHCPSLSKTLGNLALICQKWSLKLLLLKSGGTRAVQKGAKKALPLIITNNKKRTNDSKQRKNSKNLRVLWEELLCIKIHNSLLLQAMQQLCL